MSNQKQLAKEGSILMISSLIVNAGNYLINLILGRYLGPSDFSEVSLIVTLLLIISFLALGFQLSSAKYATETLDVSTKNSKLLWLYNKAGLVGLFLSFIILGLVYFWKDFFQINSIWPLVIFGCSVPIYMWMSANRGVLQGNGNFKKLAITYQMEMWVRVAFTTVFVYFGLGINGVALGLGLSLLATWLYSNSNLKNEPKVEFDTKPIINFLVLITLYECSQILINNSDTLIVKHYYSPEEAGQYAALALIGRIIYFGTWTVVTIMFPTVIKLKKEGKNHSKPFIFGLTFVALIASVLVLGAYLLPEFCINILFGEKYLSIAPFLWKYALATAFFACSNVFVYYNISLEDYFPAWITLAFGIIQVFFLVLFHQNFDQILLVQIILMFVLFVILICYQLFLNIKTRKLV